jgi:methyltransferase (TIGR00027 family)
VDARRGEGQTRGDRMTANETRGPAPGASRLLVRLVQVLLYVPIQIVFLPLALAGLAAALHREMRLGKKLGVSFTAIQALQYRWIMHQFGTRPDPRSVAFTRKLPCESHFGLWSIFGALIVAQRAFGLTTKFGRVDPPGEETLISTPGRRLLLFDEIMRKHVDEVDQVVLPGVGFDLIALNLTEGKDVRVFELDQVATLKVKAETLNRAGIRDDWVTYIPVDYSRESWVDKLLEAGFDATKKTLFLWQSVSLFLEEDVVKETLRQMSGLCVAGSTVAQDFYSTSFVSGATSRTAGRTARLVERMGEPWIFGIEMADAPRAAVEAFLRECGLGITQIHQFGEKREAEPFYCIVESTQPRRSSAVSPR